MSLPKVLSDLSKDELESLCTNCGLCCVSQIKTEHGFNVLIPDLSCKYLEMKDGESRCKVYNERHEVAKSWCRPLDKAIEEGILPNDICPYTDKLTNYIGTKVLSDEQYEKMKPVIKEVVKSKPMPEWADKEQWEEFIDD